MTSKLLILWEGINSVVVVFFFFFWIYWDDIISQNQGFKYTTPQNFIWTLHCTLIVQSKVSFHSPFFDRLPPLPPLPLPCPLTITTLLSVTVIYIYIIHTHTHTHIHTLHLNSFTFFHPAPNSPPLWQLSVCSTCPHLCFCTACQFVGFGCFIV